MDLSELAAYAEEKYHIQEQHKWADFPGFSVLCHPNTGKWIALLMRHWDSELGEEVQCCDIKCGSEVVSENYRSYISLPIRMHGSNWVGISFGEATERDVVYDLFDRAFAAEDPHGYTVVLESLPTRGSAYKDSPLPFSGSVSIPPAEKPPEKIREMKHLYEYGSNSAESRAENFYRQALFMEDYEDDVPWSGIFSRFYPTYHDLTTRQLRGYFTWRSRIRKGDYQPIPASAAYIYIYELLNGIGTESPEDALSRLRDFERGYLEAGMGDSYMLVNLHRWMFDFAIVHGVPLECPEQITYPEKEWDDALGVLRDPDAYSDDDVFAALLVFARKDVMRSPVITRDPEGSKKFFVEAWRMGQDLFSLCFGQLTERRWYPLSNAVFFDRTPSGDREYRISPCRVFCLRDGTWKVVFYERSSFDRARFQGFWRELDAKLRRYFKTGRYLKEKPEDAWAAPLADAVIEADKRAVIEASRPKITIDVSGLDRIRVDAAVTRDSLLTEEDIQELEENRTVQLPEADESLDLPLDENQVQILRHLLMGDDVSKLLRDGHMMPSIVADSINEALFDEIGDNVIICEDDRLSIIEDYIEDLEQLLGVG